jgi:cyclophilin family peptidyl-prolyl cis-trans isomerase/HEAT repeat protein
VALPAPPPRLPVEESPLEVGDTDIAILAQLLRMEDLRSLDLDRLDAWLRHPNRLIRARAALAAGRVRDTRATPLLLQALGDGSASVRADAVFALGISGDTSEAVVQSLIAKLSDPDELDVRPAVESAAALGRIGSPAAMAALFERASRLPSDSSDISDPAGLEALLHLWRAPRTTQLVALLEPLLEAHDRETRWRAAYALSRPGGMLAVAPLLDRTTDPDPGVRALAARALRRPAADNATLGDDAAAALATLLSDPDPHVRINAVNALGTYGSSPHMPAIAVLLDDGDENVIIAALQALGEARGDLAATLLAERARDAGAPVGIRAAALTALAQADAGGALRLATEWAAADDWLYRMHAGRVLGTLPHNAGTPEAVYTLGRDAHPRIAVAALRSLVARDTSASAHGLFIERLAAGEPGVRAAAVAGLARNPRAADLALLMEAYDRARTDTVPAAALAIVDALASLEQEGVDAARAFFLRFPEPGPPAVHRRVVERLGEGIWGAAPAASAGNARETAFYEDAMQNLFVPAALNGVRPRVSIGTRHGEIVLALAPDHAPLTVLNFLTLIRTGYYTEDERGGSAAHRWHRVVPNFVLQDGDPGGDGAGGPGYAIRDEINRLRYDTGVLGMALSGPDTGGSQFFITHSPQPHLDGGFTIFGRVIAGMDAAARVIQDDPILYIREVR